MSDPFAQMRGGDRDALRRLLAAHGGALKALRDHLDPEVSLEEVAEVVWKASLSALRKPEPEGHALAAVAQRLAGRPREEGPVAEVSLPTFVFAVAYAHLGLGTRREAGFVERALEAEPELAELRSTVVTALDAAKRAAGPSAAFDAVWGAIAPRLK